MINSKTTLALVVLGLLSNNACTHPPLASGYKDYSAYAESVFRRQNMLTSRIMMLNDNDLLEDNEVLIEAEEEMTLACHLLNDYAERENNGESMSLSFKSKLQDSVPGCDNSVHKLERLLEPFKQYE